MSTMTPLLFLAGSPGPLELLVIFAVVLVLFGPRKLPEIARSIGRMLHELRKASDDFRSQIMSIEDTVEKHVDEVIAPDDDMLPDDDMPPDDTAPPSDTPDVSAPGDTEADDTHAGRPS